MRVCAFELNGIPTSTHLNVLPFGSYGMLLGMDWLFTDSNKVDCYENAIECLDGHGDKEFCMKRRNLQWWEWLQLWKQSTVTGKGVYCLHCMFAWEGCWGWWSPEEIYSFLQFQDVFPSDNSELPPHREVDFSLEFVPRTTPTSKEPYRMSNPQLVEFEFQINGMVDKGYIRPSVSP